ncbi:hypothetical protein [Streptomyces sp. NPDC021020]|uniref:hypothetical protein n=1 Tax=Streptomyces sp. NPDC021020 TaxID=3365109 RepID=UPI0037B98C42
MNTRGLSTMGAAVGGDGAGAGAGAAMVTVQEAAEAFVEREVAAMRRGGCQVWVSRCPEQDVHRDGRSTFGYWIATDDGLGALFEPLYRGSPGDLLPAGYDDFGLYVGGGKVDEYPSDGSDGSDRHADHPPLAVTAQDGTPLRFAGRIDSPQSADEWLSRPDAYVRCDHCMIHPPSALRVGDPEEECDCGALERDEDGRLTWGEEYRYTFPTVFLPA